MYHIKLRYEFLLVRVKEDGGKRQRKECNWVI